MSGTQIITATIHDELVRSRRRGWSLVAALLMALAVAWVFPRLDQTSWTIPPVLLAAGLMAGAVGAAHRQRMFGRRRLAQVTSALLTVAMAAAILAVVLLVNRWVGAAPGSSPLEIGMLWLLEQDISPFAPAAAMGVVLLLWIPVIVDSQREVQAEAAAWRATHGPDGFTPLA